MHKSRKFVYVSVKGLRKGVHHRMVVLLSSLYEPDLLMSYLLFFLIRKGTSCFDITTF